MHTLALGTLLQLGAQHEYVRALPSHGCWADVSIHSSEKDAALPCADVLAKEIMSGIVD